MQITVIGIGYVGFVTAVVLADKGHAVTCLDIDASKIEQMRNSISPIYEPGLQELMLANKERLSYTCDPEQAYSNAEVVFIAVPTPEKDDGTADLSYVYSACNDVFATLTKDIVLVIKSTVPVGTNKDISDYISHINVRNLAVSVVSNPEFLSQGTAVNDMLHPKRIVVGSECDNANNVMKEVYKDFDTELVITDLNSAEMIKYASNCFLALKISYINEISNLCEKTGADIESVAHGMGLDPRIGKDFLQAGVGYGGSCFPKDTKALHKSAENYGVTLNTVKATIDTNENQIYKLLEKAEKYYSDFSGLNIAVLGGAFKPGTDDLREAPAVSNITKLIEKGTNIKVWDKCATSNLERLFGQSIFYCDTIVEALENADLCFIFTEVDEIKQLSAETFLKMKAPIVLDGRNCFSLNEMDKQALIYESIGRRTIYNLEGLTK